MGGSWEVKELGEWGLRFWVLICLRFETTDDTDWRFCSERGVLTGCCADHWVAVAGERAPLLVTYHEDLEALGREYETHGYWYLDSRDASGALAVLRYNLEEMPALEFAYAMGDSEAGARENAAPALAGSPPAPLEVLHTGRHEGALDAIRDVIGWNTVYDDVNKRPYTALSRTWSMVKFGGFGVWLSDVLYHGLLASVLDKELAIDNLRAALAGATEAGNLPCLLTGRDAWVDRSHPPIATFILWLIYLRWGNRPLLEECYPVLVANHEWWWRERDGNHNALLEYGTSPVGRGLYRGTKLAAKDESVMDNSPVHDEATLNEDSWTLDCEDVALNSLVALDGEMLAKVANELGHGADAANFTECSEAHRQRISSTLWDPERKIFANRLWSGEFVRSLAPTSFFPLIAGAATPTQVASLLQHLHDPARFGGTYVLPSVSRDDPAYPENVYWRGRVWPPLNFLVYQGLRRYGLFEAATDLAHKSYTLFMQEWTAHRWCAENYGAETGAARDQPDTDTFYAWGALLPLMAVSDLVDISPWGGFEIQHEQVEFRLGGFRSPLGNTTVASSAGFLSLHVDETCRVRTNIRGRVHIGHPDKNVLELAVPPQPGPTQVELPGVRLVHTVAQLDERPFDGEELGDGVRFNLPRLDAKRHLRIEWSV